MAKVDFSFSKAFCFYSFDLVKFIGNSVIFSCLLPRCGQRQRGPVEAKAVLLAEVGEVEGKRAERKEYI